MPFLKCLQEITKGHKKNAKKSFLVKAVTLTRRVFSYEVTDASHNY